MTAMVGSNFCKASQDAFTLITSNILRGFFVNQVADFVILLGKIFVVGLTTLFFRWIFVLNLYLYYYLYLYLYLNLNLLASCPSFSA